MATMPRLQFQTQLFHSDLMTEGSILRISRTELAVAAGKHLVLAWAMQERRW